MQLQMEAQSQVVPQWLVALEQQRRATMQEGLAAMQTPQQQTTVMEDLATKTAAPVQPAPQEGLAQFAEGGSVGKKDRWQAMLDDFAGSSDEFVVQSAPGTMEQMQSLGAPKSYINKLQSLWTEAQNRLDKPREFQAPAPVETSMETLGTADKDTQPIGIEEASYAKPMDQNLADRFTRLDEMSKTSPQAAKNTAEAFLQASQGRSELPPEYMQTLEAFVNQPLPTPAPQPEQGISQALPQPTPVQPPPAPMALKEETLALPEPTLEALTSQGPADTSPVQQTKFLSPEQQEAAITDYVKANPGTNVTPNTAPPMTQEEYERQMAVVDGLAAIPTTPTQPAPVPQSIPAQQPTLETLQAPAVPKRPEPVVPDDVKSYWDIMKQGGEMPKPNLESFDKKSSRKEGQLKYAEDNNLSMALMSASAAILAGESPFTMVNLGKGFTAGLQQYANGRKNINDLQDQIDDVVMARDKALNDQNMREFELQNNRLGTLAMIKQKVDMANAQNATELEKARMMAEAHLGSARMSANAHMAGIDKSNAAMMAQERGRASVAVNSAMGQLTAARENMRKFMADKEKMYPMPSEREAARQELEAQVQYAQDNLQSMRDYAVSVGLPITKSTGTPKGGANPNVRMIPNGEKDKTTGIKVLGDK